MLIIAKSVRRLLAVTFSFISVGSSVFVTLKKIEFGKDSALHYYYFFFFILLHPIVKIWLIWRVSQETKKGRETESSIVLRAKQKVLAEMLPNAGERNFSRQRKGDPECCCTVEGGQTHAVSAGAFHLTFTFFFWLKVLQKRSSCYMYKSDELYVNI